VEHTGLEPATF